MICSQAPGWVAMGVSPHLYLGVCVTPLPRSHGKVFKMTCVMSLHETVTLGEFQEVHTPR